MALGVDRNKDRFRNLRQNCVFFSICVSISLFRFPLPLNTKQGYLNTCCVYFLLLNRTLSWDSAETELLGLLRA